MAAWIKRRDVVNGTRRIEKEKLLEHQYIKLYVKYLVSNGIEGDDGRNNDQI